MLPMQVRREQQSWDPIDAMHREFDRMFGRWLNDGNTQRGGATAFYPVDVREDDDHIYFDAELPGFKKDEIDITLENGLLTINAERKCEEGKEQPKGEMHLCERRYTRVSRSFTLPTAVDEGSVDAKLQDGVLHLTLSKREEVKPRKIQVK